MKVILNNVQVKAVASWLPKNILEMVSLGAEYGDTEVANIMKATGVERARIADKDMCSSDMCQKAAEALMEKDGINKDEIDGLVFVSQTCDWILPSTSIALQDRLGLSKDTVCIDIHNVCPWIYTEGFYRRSIGITLRSSFRRQPCFKKIFNDR